MNFKETVEDIRARADIVEIISAYVQLKKRGKNFLGLCPFHSEKTPSFNVSQEKGLFHCFGCKEGGNVFDFIMKIEKVEFGEAVKILGEKMGIAVETSPTDIKLKNERERLYEINQLACKFFENNLEPAVISYLKDRGLNEEAISHFHLGFAKDGWDNLFNCLIGKGFSPLDIERAGLIIKKENSSDYYDRFRKRIIFPVFDLRGRAVGFSGRAFGEGEPKYLNSPDSSVFHKGEILFGLNEAQEEIKKKKFVILVEGNVDLMLCHQHGYKNTAAPLGTAFTEIQARLLKRFAEAVIICFDSDAAGISASERALNILKAEQIKVRIAELGGKKDPADYLAEYGAAAFTEILKASQPALEFKIRQAIKKFNLGEVEGRASAIEKTAEILSQESSPVLQNEYINFSAKLLECDPNTLISEVKRRSFYNKGANAHSRLYRTISKPPSKIEEAEKCLIRIGLEDPEARKQIIENLKPEDFSSAENVEILRQLILNPEIKPDDFQSENEKTIVRELILNSPPLKDSKQMIKDCIDTIKFSHLQAERDKIRSQMKKEEDAGNLLGLKKLQEEFKKLHEISKIPDR